MWSTLSQNIRISHSHTDIEIADACHAPLASEGCACGRPPQLGWQTAVNFSMPRSFDVHWVYQFIWVSYSFITCHNRPQILDPCHWCCGCFASWKGRGLLQLLQLLGSRNYNDPSVLTSSHEIIPCFWETDRMVSFRHCICCLGFAPHTLQVCIGRM